METVFWTCVIGGALFAIVTVLLGDLISSAIDGLFDFMSVDQFRFLRPMVIVTFITTFGGAGLVLLYATSVPILLNVVFSILIAFALSWIVYVAYVRPMENSENSIAFSIRDLSGRIGEVITPIPAKGYGEVLIRVGAGHTNQIAASFEGTELASGVRVVVVDVNEDTVFVAPMDEDGNQFES